VAINRVLAGHFHAYESLVSVLSRLVGNTPLVEVSLGFAAGRISGEVQGVVDPGLGARGAGRTWRGGSPAPRCGSPR
jgi:hypothetical protein